MKKSTRNRLVVSFYLGIVIVFTGLMTFYAGPKMMALRTSVQNDKLLYKCRDIISGDTIIVQMRGWEKPNTNAMVRVKLAGVTAPPPFAETSPEVAAWANLHGRSRAEVARFGKTSRNALRAFLRYQNLSLVRPDGENIRNLDGTNVVAHVMVFGSDVGDKQLKGGQVLHLPDAPQAYVEEYVDAAKTAQKRKSGLWRAVP